MSKNQNDNALNPYNVYYDNYLDTDACTECTGLMPTPALNFSERENYRQVFNYTREFFSPPENHSGDIHSD